MKSIDLTHRVSTSLPSPTITPADSQVMCLLFPQCEDDFPKKVKRKHCPTLFYRSDLSNNALGCPHSRSRMGWHFPSRERPRELFGYSQANSCHFYRRSGIVQAQLQTLFPFRANVRSEWRCRATMRLQQSGLSKTPWWKNHTKDQPDSCKHSGPVSWALHPCTQPTRWKDSEINTGSLGTWVDFAVC
jgi:hypothetical protein